MTGLISLQRNPSGFYVGSSNSSGEVITAAGEDGGGFCWGAARGSGGKWPQSECNLKYEAPGWTRWLSIGLLISAS